MFFPKVFTLKDTDFPFQDLLKANKGHLLTPEGGLVGNPIANAESYFLSFKRNCFAYNGHKPTIDNINNKFYFNGIEYELTVNAVQGFLEFLYPGLGNIMMSSWPGQLPEQILSDFYLTAYYGLEKKFPKHGYKCKIPQFDPENIDSSCFHSVNFYRDSASQQIVAELAQHNFLILNPHDPKNPDPNFIKGDIHCQFYFMNDTRATWKFVAARFSNKTVYDVICHTHEYAEATANAALNPFIDAYISTYMLDDEEIKKNKPTSKKSMVAAFFGFFGSDDVDMARNFFGYKKERGVFNILTLPLLTLLNTVTFIPRILINIAKIFTQFLPLTASRALRNIADDKRLSAPIRFLAKIGQGFFKLWEFTGRAVTSPFHGARLAYKEGRKASKGLGLVLAVLSISITAVVSLIAFPFMTKAIVSQFSSLGTIINTVGSVFKSGLHIAALSAHTIGHTALWIGSSIFGCLFSGLKYLSKKLLSPVKSTIDVQKTSSVGIEKGNDNGDGGNPPAKPSTHERSNTLSGSSNHLITSESGGTVIGSSVASAELNRNTQNAKTLSSGSTHVILKAIGGVKSLFTRGLISQPVMRVLSTSDVKKRLFDSGNSERKKPDSTLRNLASSSGRGFKS